MSFLLWYFIDTLAHYAKHPVRMNIVVFMAHELIIKQINNHASLDGQNLW
jgi:hypothetical protein